MRTGRRARRAISPCAQTSGKDVTSPAMSRTVTGAVRRVHRAVSSRVDMRGLLYTQDLFLTYDEYARRDAPLVMPALKAAFPDITSLVDVGAGTGRFVAEGNAIGLNVIGLERSPIGRRMGESIGSEMHPLGFRSSRPVTCDLSYSFEVAEHLSRRLADRYVMFMTGSAPIVVVTAASPGQEGTGHLNEQPASYWIEKFRLAGFDRDPEREAALYGDLPYDRLSPHWSMTNRFVFTTATRHG